MFVFEFAKVRPVFGSTDVMCGRFGHFRASYEVVDVAV